MKKKSERNKQRYFAAVLCGAVLAACPAASVSARADQVIYQEKAGLENLSLEWEAVSPTLDLEQYTLLHTQLTQLLEACREPIERMNPDKVSFYTPTKEELQELSSCAAALGLPVSWDGEMENPESIIAFLEAVQRGEDAHVFYARFDASNICCEAFWFRDGLLYNSVGWAERLDPAHPYISGTDHIISMKLTDEGHLLYSYPWNLSDSPPSEEEKSAGEPGECRQNYYLLCIHETDPKAAACLNKYIAPLSMDPRGCALTTNWDPEHLDRLNWEALFADAYRLETQKNMWKAYPNRKTIIWKPENQPDGVDDRELIVPSADVEALLEKYYPVTQEQLRKSKFYDEKRDAYIFVKPTLYGTAPADFPEVTAYRENEDGALTLTVNCISRYGKQAVKFTSEITVQPREDGSYQYRSNRTNFVSKDSGDW